MPVRFQLGVPKGNKMIYIILGFIIIGIICYACCAAAGKADRAAERYYEENYRKN